MKYRSKLGIDIIPIGDFWSIKEKLKEGSTMYWPQTFENEIAARSFLAKHFWSKRKESRQDTAVKQALTTILNAKPKRSKYRFKASERALDLIIMALTYADEFFDPLGVTAEELEELTGIARNLEMQQLHKGKKEVKEIEIEEFIPLPDSAKGYLKGA